MWRWTSVIVLTTRKPPAVPTITVPFCFDGGGAGGPVILNLILIFPPGRHVQRVGALIFPLHDIAPLLTMHLPYEVATIAVTVQPGPGTQANLLIDPRPLWFWTVSSYTPESITRSDKFTSEETFADWSGSTVSASAAAATTSAAAASEQMATAQMRPVTSTYPVRI